MPHLSYSSEWLEPTLLLLLIGVALAASSTAIIGTFGLLEKRGLAGDAIAHAFLPGVCVAFLLTHQKATWILTLGCFGSGGLALLLLNHLSGYAKIKRENSVALVLSIFLGLGLLLLGHIQHRSDGSQVGLQHFLLGSISSLMDQDLWLFGALNLLVILVTFLLFRSWRLVMFDREFAKSTGQPIKSLQFIFHLLSLLAIVIGVQTIGIILMSAMLLAPAMAARFWTDRLDKMLGVAVFISVFASFLGVCISYVMRELPTGPCIALSMNALALVSFIIAPKRGWLARYYKRHAYQAKIIEENILKAMYEMDKTIGNGREPYTLSKIGKQLSRRKHKIEEGIRKLLAKGWISKIGEGLFTLTGEGEAKGKSIHRLHLLWEAYLEHHLGIQADHVHDDAESIEHMITPELEKELLRLVGGKLNLSE